MSVDALPLPFATVHSCHGGAPLTFTAYADPLAIAVENLKAPLEATATVSASLICNLIGLQRPETMPPMLWMAPGLPGFGLPGLLGSGLPEPPPPPPAGGCPPP